MEQQLQTQQKTCWTCGSMHQGKNCSTNVTHFIWKHGGTNINITGTWNKWQASIKMNPIPEKKEWFQATLSLPIGKYQYKYIVDSVWCYDINDSKVSDGMGGFNNILEVVPKFFTIDDTTETEQSDQEPESNNSIRSNSPTKQRNKVASQTMYNQTRKIKITTGLDAQSILVSGSWDNWSKQNPMTRRFNNVLNRWENETEIQLQPGKYYYKYILNGIYVCDNQQKMVKNDMGSFNNLLYIPVQQMKQRIQKKVKFNPKQLKWKYEHIYNIGSEKMIGHTMGVIGDSIYIYAGQKDIGEYRDSMYELNMPTWDIDTVEFENQAPPARAFHQSIIYGDKILIVGGLGEDKILNDCWAFNISYRTWEKYELKGQMPNRREKSSSCYYKQKSCMILFGGYYCTEDLEAEYHYNDTYSLNLANMVWTQMNTTGQHPKVRFAAGMEIYQSTVFIFGGQQYLNASPYEQLNDVWTLNLETQDTNVNWVEQTNNIKGKPPAKRYGHSMLRMKHYFVIFGGKGKNGVLYQDTWILDAKKLEWIYPQIFGIDPSPRYFHTAAKMNECEIVIMGGCQQGTRKQRKIHILSCIPDEEYSEDGEQNSKKSQNQTQENTGKQKGPPKLKKIHKTSSEILEQNEKQTLKQHNR